MARQNQNQPQSSPPPFYEATQDIYLGHPEAGTTAVAAFRAGDRVPAGILEEHDVGDALKVPDEFAGQYSSPSGPPVPAGTVTSAAQVAPAGEALPEAPGKE